MIQILHRPETSQHVDDVSVSELNEIHNAEYNEIQRVAFTRNAALSMLKYNIQNTCDVSGYVH